MAFRKASKPAPVKINVPSSGFYGLKCPFCNEQKLRASASIPACYRCIEKLGLTEDILNKLQGHFFVLPPEINWAQEPHPRIVGSIDDIPWQASFVLQRWSVQILNDEMKTEERKAVAGIVHQLLDVYYTPSYLERMTKKKTPLKKYVFIATLGATIVTAAHFAQKLAEKKAREQKEAEEAEGVKKDALIEP